MNRARFLRTVCSRHEQSCLTSTCTVPSARTWTTLQDATSGVRHTGVLHMVTLLEVKSSESDPCLYTGTLRCCACAASSPSCNGVLSFNSMNTFVFAVLVCAQLTPFVAAFTQSRYNGHLLVVTLAAMTRLFGAQHAASSSFPLGTIQQCDHGVWIPASNSQVRDKIPQHCSRIFQVNQSTKCSLVQTCPLYHSGNHITLNRQPMC